ncbi:endothelin-converting enzyme 1-like isoform X2 [Rhinatrema bivittatum]|uniref:endothelin-converting enzyme 1-like isoform X2 n=1 Tax=Rhinatrema bivittatum TaxID=194408 RepID=UPI001129007D|nr:endothelin-converting enzyme 1-like isoform X2 [Rhinatrema bivittatum]
MKTSGHQQQARFEEQKLSERWQKRLRRLLPLSALLTAVLIAFAVLLTFTVQSCSRGLRNCDAHECESLQEIFLGSRDLAADPCQDFFSYVCGNWASRHPVKAGTGSASTFSNLWEENQRIVRDLLETSQHGNGSSAEEKAHRFYQSCMNIERVQELGAQPMIELINKLGGWSVAGPWNRTDFNKTLHVLMGEYNTFPFFKAYLDSSPRNPNARIIQIDHPDFDMPSKSQFADEMDYPKGLRIYLSYLMTLGELLGGRENMTSIQIPAVFSFMSKLLNEVTPLAERQARGMLFQNTTIQELQELAPSIDWLSSLRAVFHPLALNTSQSILVHDMEYLKGISRLLGQWQKTFLQIYMILCLVQNLTPALDDRFQRARRELNERLKGSSTQTTVLIPRWKKCVSETSSFYEPVVGAMFVRETFEPKTKKLAEEMFSEVRATLRSRLESLEWMDELTRQEAIDKLESIKVQIGYPPQILNTKELDREYAEFEPHEDTFFANVLEFLRSSRKWIHLGPMDTHGEENWEVAPSSVYSYYSLRHNAVVFPAGMFRSPFFHRHFPSAVNFGSVGMFMAHELLHAFYEYVFLGLASKQGDALEEGTHCLVGQYERYTLHGLTVNGTVTLLENMADSDGLTIAHQAYKSWLQKQKHDRVLPKLRLSPPQLFFASFAQAFCGTENTEGLQESLFRDRHSPSQVRVLGAIANSEEFGGLFQCPRGSPMNPESKCRIW